MILASSVEDIVFHVANALKVPVLVAALIALALALAEAGALGVEVFRRHRRSRAEIQRASAAAGQALDSGDRKLALSRLAPIASSARMWGTLQILVEHARDGEMAPNRMAKSLADYDLASMKRLERPRMLVRAGPALGLMGTLIPLSPALDGLANGNTKQLTENLRVAFSVTVLGLFIGALAFGISLVRDRLYAQDLSDMEAVAAEISPTGGTLVTDTPSGDQPAVNV